MGDIRFLGQIVDSLAEAVEKMERAKKKNKIRDFNELKGFVLGLKSKLDTELMDG